MNTPYRSSALLLAAFAVLTTLAACTSAGTTTTPTTLTDTQILAIGKELAQCLRENGFPDLADPVMVDVAPRFLAMVTDPGGD
jgi:hypothetical protein